jgi:hypothetical protein
VCVPAEHIERRRSAHEMLVLEHTAWWSGLNCPFRMQRTEISFSGAF